VIKLKDSFFSFDDLPPVAISEPIDPSKFKFLQDPRDIGGVLVQTKPVERGAACSICDTKKLVLEIFYFEGSKIRKFVRCTNCNKYLFELVRRHR